MASQPRWEIYEDEIGEWRFRFKAANNEIVMDSEGYKTSASVHKAISVIEKSIKASSFQLQRHFVEDEM